jgi:redox-sensitive bicupin YhaK (pirin superfamily)
MSSSRMPLDALIVPRTRDLGEGFQVRCALPDAKRRMVGPFVFFDQMVSGRPGSSITLSGAPP